MDPPFIPDGGVTLRLPFSCDLAQAREAAKRLRAFLEEHGVESAELFACELCLTEACTNAVRHAGPAGRGRMIVAEAICTLSTTELRVTDHTPGFELPTKLHMPAPARESGRGVFIIQSMMDEVRYLRGTDSNTLVMSKRRARPVPSADAPRQTRAAVEQQVVEYRRTIGSMARELCFRSESLAAIFRCCTELGRAGDLEGFARRLFGDLLHLTSSDWYVLRLLSPHTPELAVFSVSDPRLASPALQINSALPAQSELANAELETASKRVPVPFSSRVPHTSGLVQPVLFGDTLVGTLAIGRRRDAKAFSELQTEVIRTFAEFMAIQVVNLRHQEAHAGAKVMRRELEIARSIQQASFPRSLPQAGAFTVAGRWQSARQVAGDFYDAIPLGDRSLLLVVADVMGKGVPAAMFATITRALVRALAFQHRRPSDLLRRLNALLYDELSAVDMFITAQVARLDLDTRQLVVANAGHCPAFVVSGAAREVRCVGPTGTPLGIVADPRYDQERTILAEAACLLLHTDGLTESFNAAGEMFGTGRLGDWLRTSTLQARTADELAEELSVTLARFRGETPLRDDQTFLVCAEASPLLAAPRHGEPRHHSHTPPPFSSAQPALPL